MPLTSTGEAATYEVFEIEFVMLDGSERIVCRVDIEAIDGLGNSSTPTKAERLRVFEPNRARLERIASQLHDAGYAPCLTAKHL
jgi:hypothetical protein